MVMEKNGIGKDEREYWVDAVKGIACFVVFLHHFILAFGSEIYGIGPVTRLPFLSFLTNGNWAVCLFLIISSYVLCTQVLRMEHPEGRRLGGMMLKRYFRLLFPVATVSALAYLLGRSGLFANLAVSQLEGNTMLGTFYPAPMTFQDLLYTTLIDVWWSGNSMFNGPFWMMGYLLKGSILAILLGALIRKNRRGWLVIAAMLTLYFCTQSYYFCSVLGVLWAYGKEETTLLRPAQGRLPRAALLALGAAALAALGYVPKVTGFFAARGFGETFLSNYVFWNALSAGTVLLIGAKCGAVGKLLGESRLLRAMSRVSFGVFLFHWPLICSLSCRLYLMLAGKISDMWMVKSLLLVITLPATLLLAGLYTRFLENGLYRKAVEGITNWYGKGERENSNN